MSYVLQIWENPKGQVLPATVEEADLLLKNLSRNRTGQNQRFIDLACRLMLRCPPSVAEDENESLPLEGCWSDMPLTGRSEDAVFGLGINVEKLDKARPTVIEEAIDLGLCVMDEQAGEVYLPNGAVLIRAEAKAAIPEAASEKYDDVPKTKELTLLAADRLRLVLAEYGFKGRKGSRSFKRVFAHGWQEIEVYADRDWWPCSAEFEVRAYVRFHPVSDLVWALADPEMSLDDVREQFTLLALQRNWMEKDESFSMGFNNFCKVVSYSEIDAVIEGLISRMRTRLLPALEKCKTIEGIDQALNPQVGEKSLFSTFHGGKNNIIAAYLAGNPNLESLCRAVEAEFLADRGFSESVRDQTRRCIEYVRKKSHGSFSGG